MEYSGHHTECCSSYGSYAPSETTKDDCTLGEVVHVWIKLLQAPVLEPYKQIIIKRFNQCITPLHLVAYQAHPLYKGVNLTGEQEEKAAEWIRGIDPEYVAPLLAFGIEDKEVYPKSMLDTSVSKSLHLLNGGKF